MIKKDSEKLVERKLVEFVKGKRGLCLKLLSSIYRGLPDRMCLMPQGKIYFVELKTTGEKPRESQLVVHKRLRELGFDVRVIDTVIGAKEFVESISESNEKRI